MTSGKTPNSGSDPAGRKKAWLIFGVSAITLIIFCLWGWSWKKMVENFSWKNSREGQIAGEVSAEWNRVAELKTQVAEERRLLQNTLEKLANQSAAAATSTLAATTTAAFASTTPTTTP